MLSGGITRRMAYNDPDSCEVCKRTLPLRVLHEHHIVPVSKGGHSNKENKMLVCPTCHALIHHFYLGEESLENMNRERILEVMTKGVKTVKASSTGYTGLPKPCRMFAVYDRYGKIHGMGTTQISAWMRATKSILGEDISAYEGKRRFLKKGFVCYYAQVTPESNTQYS